MRLLSALLLLAATNAFAISELDYNAHYDAEVAPFYQTGVSGTFTGVGGIKLSYRTWENPNERAAIVFVNGRTETYIKYAELAYDLSQAGYSIYMIDHRGQGFSDRLIKNPHIGYVRHYQDYVTDLKTFVDTVVNAKPHAKRFMVGHSMGGGMTALYNELYPNDFDGVGLSAPMLEVNTSPYPEWAAYDIASLACDIGLGSKLAPGQSEFDTAPFEKNTLTHSRPRYEKTDELAAEFPQTYVGGASNRWVQQSMELTTKVHNLVKQIKAPVLLFQAGDDKLVRPDGEKYFCDHVPNCKLVPLAGSFHEILMERDEIRNQAISGLLEFFHSHL